MDLEKAPGRDFDDGSGVGGQHEYSRRRGASTTVAPRRGRGRPKTSSDDSQRATIARQALELFVDLGFGGTTISDIADRSGISRRTIYRLFKSKLALFVAAVEHHRRSVVALPGEYADLSFEQALERIFITDIAPAEDAKRVAFLRVVLGERHLFPKLIEILRSNGREVSTSLLADWLEGEKAAGRAAFADARLVASIMMDLALQPLDANARGEGSHLPPGLSHGQYVSACLRFVAAGMMPVSTAAKSSAEDNVRAA